MYIKEDVNTVPPHFIETPSFSLGLTQEEHIRSAEPLTRHEVANVTTLSDINVGDNISYPLSLRKSKRQKTVPPALVHDYLCGPHMDSRLRPPRETVFVCYERREIERKINVLLEKLSGNVLVLLLPTMLYSEYQIAVFVESLNLEWLCCLSVINVGGLAVSSKEMLLLAERSRLYPGKVSNETSCISLKQ